MYVGWILLHSCMFAYSQTGRTLSISLPCSSLSQKPVSMTKFSFGVQCVSNCFTDKLVSLMLRHLSPTFNMLLPVSAHAVNGAKCHYIHIETHAWFCNMV